SLEDIVKRWSKSNFKNGLYGMFTLPPSPPHHLPTAKVHGRCQRSPPWMIDFSRYHIAMTTQWGKFITGPHSIDNLVGKTPSKSYSGPRSSSSIDLRCPGTSDGLTNHLQVR
ncbi:hypothetical protein Bbelb_439410, partial [Branchiostoma belcheri]